MTPSLIPRSMRSLVEDHLGIFPAVALLGPRQVGKTTLARIIADAGRHTGAQGPGLYLDLVLELPGGAVWAIEVKRSSAPKVGRGLRTALDDVKPDRAFMVYGGKERYPAAGGIEAIGLRELEDQLAG